MLPQSNTKSPGKGDQLIDRQWLALTLHRMHAEWVRWSRWDRSGGVLTSVEAVSANPSRMRRLLAEWSMAGGVDWRRLPFHPQVNPVMAKVFEQRQVVAAPWFALSAGIIPTTVTFQAWQQKYLRYGVAAPVVMNGRVAGLLTWFDGKPFDAHRQKLARQFGEQVSTRGERAVLAVDPIMEDGPIQAADRVRQEIAETLHGHVQTTLLVAAERVRSCARSLEGVDPVMALELQQVFSMLEEVREHDIRMLSHRLHPGLISVGLRAALLSLIRSWKPTIEVRLEVSPSVAAADTPVNNQIPQDVCLTLYRIVEEGIANAFRHGHAQTVSVALWDDITGIGVSIQDDGEGFPPARLQRGLGLSTLAARVSQMGGQWHLINNQDLPGSELAAWLPLERLSAMVQAGDQPNHRLVTSRGSRPFRKA